MNAGAALGGLALAVLVGPGAAGRPGGTAPVEAAGLELCVEAESTVPFVPREFLPGVVEGDGRLVVVTAPTVKLQARALGTGHGLWEVAPTEQPLAVVGEALLAQRVESRRELRLVWREAASGKELEVSPPLVLPEWASALDEPGQALEVEAWAEGEAVVVVWRARRTYAGGAPPPLEVLREVNRAGSGGVRWGRGGAPEVLCRERVPAVALPEALVEVVSYPYWTGTTLEERAYVVPGMNGEELVVLRLVQVAEGQELWRDRYEAATSEAVANERLMAGEALRPMLAGDGSLFVHDAMAPGEWAVFGPGGAEEVARVARPALAVAARLEDGVLYVLEDLAPPTFRETTEPPPPRRLRAIAAASGETLWSLEIVGGGPFTPPP